MNKSKYYFLYFILLLFVCTNAYSQMSSEQVDQLVRQAMQKFNVAGVAVGIVKDGKIIHSKGYGVKSIKTKAPVDSHTGFDIASNSKAFTTAALSILQEEGKISWQTKVVDVIPEFKMYNPYVTANFNIQDLLTHRSGLGLGAGDLMFWPDSNDFTMQDILTNFQYFEPVSPFRTKYDYDNVLYVIAGEVIARVSGMSWEKFITTRILQPLGMDQSYATFFDVKDESTLALPHSTETGTMRVIRRDTFDPQKINGAAASIISNTDDLCRWILLQLNHGKYGESLEKKLFSEKNHKEMWKIHTILNPNSDPRYNSHFHGYGLGWHLEDLNGKMSVSHTGGLAGMLSRTVMIPELNLGVVILTNTWHGGSYLYRAVSNTIVDSYLGMPGFDWTADYYKKLQQSQSKADSVVTLVWQTVNATSNHVINAQDYIGVYQDKWFGKVEVYVNKDQLWFKSYRSPKLNGPMQFYKANTFAIRWEYQDTNCDAFAIFSLDENGRADHIRMKGISPDIDFSFDFQDLDLCRVNIE